MKLPLKIYIFALVLIAIIIPAKGQNEETITLLPNGKVTLRYPVMKEGKINFDLRVHKGKLTKAFQIGTATGAGYVAGTIALPKPSFEQARPQRNIPLKVSLFSSLVAFNLFSAKRPSGLIIRVDEYSTNHELIKSRYLPVTKRKSNFSYNFISQPSQNGYIDVSISNIKH